MKCSIVQEHRIEMVLEEDRESGKLVMQCKVIVADGKMLIYVWY